MLYKTPPSVVLGLPRAPIVEEESTLVETTMLDHPYVETTTTGLIGDEMKPKLKTRWAVKNYLSKVVYEILEIKHEEVILFLVEGEAHHEKITTCWIKTFPFSFIPEKDWKKKVKYKTKQLELSL